MSATEIYIAISLMVLLALMFVFFFDSQGDTVSLYLKDDKKGNKSEFIIRRSSSGEIKGEFEPDKGKPYQDMRTFLIELFKQKNVDKQYSDEYECPRFSVRWRDLSLHEKRLFRSLKKAYVAKVREMEKEEFLAWQRAKEVENYIKRRKERLAKDKKVLEAAASIGL